MSTTVVKKRLERMLRLSTTALLITATLACSGLRQTLHNGAGYKAKALASGVFVSGREAEAVIREDLSDGPWVLVSGRVDPEDRSASAGALRLVRSKAICREGLGCTLVKGLTEDEIRSQPYDPPTVSEVDPGEIPWPSGDALPDLPTDTSSARGHEGQEVVVIPSRELVLVRLGQFRPESTYGSNGFGAAVLAAIEE